MKIEQIQLHHVSMPLRHHFETSFGKFENRHCVLVEIKAEGLTAYGESPADAHPGYSYETIGTVLEIGMHELAPALLELDDPSPENFQTATHHVKGHPMAKAGFEMALWDLAGKQEQKSLSALIGSKKTTVEVGVSLGIEERSEDLLEKVLRFDAIGYPRIKIKIKPGHDIVPLRYVRKHMSEIQLQVDANSAYTLDAARKLKALEEIDLLMLEQPLAEDDLWDHSILQQEIDIPICLDESIHSLRHTRQAHEMAACQIINIKAGRVGGILEAVKIHDFALQHDIPVWCGGMLETGVGRAANLALAGLPGFVFPGDISATDRYYEQDITIQQFHLNSDGTIDVPRAPGLGVSVDQDNLKRFTQTTISIPSRN